MPDLAALHNARLYCKTRENYGLDAAENMIAGRDKV
jgi:hypothetical protein